jgi:hypothetical protein
MLAERVIGAITEDSSPCILFSLIACVAGALHDIAFDRKEDTSSELVVLTVFNRSGYSRLCQASNQWSFHRARGRRGDLPQAEEHGGQARPQFRNGTGLRDDLDLDLGGLPLSLLPAQRGALRCRGCAFPGDASCLEKPDVDESVDSRNADQNYCAYDTEDNVTEMRASALVRQDPKHGAASGPQKGQGGQADRLGPACPRCHLRCFRSGSPQGTDSLFSSGYLNQNIKLALEDHS